MSLADDDSPSAVLRELRDALRGNTIADADDFLFRLSGALDALGVPSGAPAPKISLVAEVSSSSKPSERTLKAIARHLPAVQQALAAVAPTFVPALDARGLAVLRAFFAPPPAAAAAAGPAVALAAYGALSALLAPTAAPPLPVPARGFVLDTLAATVTAYGIDRLYEAVFASTAGEDAGGVQTLAWEDAVRTAASVPAKAANAVGRWREAAWDGKLPPALMPRTYFDSMGEHLESLAYELALDSTGKGKEQRQTALRAVFEKLAALGLLTPRPSETRVPALLPAFLPRALEHLHPPAIAPPYPATFLPRTLLPLSASALSALAGALLSHLPARLPPLEAKPEQAVRRAADVLTGFLGQPGVGGEAWTALVPALLKRMSGTDSDGDASHAAARRMVVAWVGSGGKSPAAGLIDEVMNAWSEPKAIRFGSYAQQFNHTHTLIVALSLLPSMDAHVVALSRRGRFIQAVQAYLSHPDAKIRRLGMLVAEIVSERSVEEGGVPAGLGVVEKDDVEDLVAGLEVDEETGESKQPKRANAKPLRGPKRLQFTGMWDGDGEGRTEARWLRAYVGVRDGEAVLSDDAAAWMLGWDVPPPAAEPAAPAPEPTRGRRPEPKPKADRSKARAKPPPKIVMLDDDQVADPLQGYASSPSSSRSPSPTPEYLAEVAADPTLAVDATKKRKLKRPVYVRQLAELLRDKDKPDSIELALQWGEGLVRAKRNFGTEVSENAVAVAAAALALANPFNLDDFEVRRQGLVTALVACSPRNVPPFLAEQYFNTSHSLHQKSVMLTALAMGARELAGLPVPEARTARTIDFPTKTLPPSLHAKYLTAADAPHSAGVGGAQPFAGQLDAAMDGMRSLLLSRGAERADAVPEIAREKRLRVVSKRRKVGDAAVQLDSSMDVDTPDVQAPIIPFSAVAAEFFILPLVNRFWDYFQDAGVRESRALSLGSRYRAAGTGMVLSPLALDKFLLTLALLSHAARHAPTFLAVLVPSVLELAATVGARHLAAPDSFGVGSDNPGERDASVTGSALELALAVLDAAGELDSGRTLARDSPQLVAGVAEWAGAVFEAENAGHKAGGGGGSREGRVRAAAAGVVVRVAEIGDKWGRTAF